MNFITGDQFKNKANYILDEQGLRENQILKNNTPIYFVKTNYIDNFFNSSFLPKSKFILITHNSDFSININHSEYMNYPYLVKWYAQNVDYKNDILVPIPIGIANAQWPHGNVEVLKNTIDQNHKKKLLMYANFNLNTNISVRKNCLQNIQIKYNKYIENNVSFDVYLKHTSESYFSICPLGNGIDSHRIWESLYLKTIPITENTYNIDYLKNKFNLPIIFINKWEEINNITLTEKTYYDTIKLFDPSILNVETFMI